jgi:hypothetical protein
VKSSGANGYLIFNTHVRTPYESTYYHLCVQTPVCWSTGIYPWAA